MAQGAAQTAPSAERTDGNVIYIGKKSVMGYVLAVVTQFNNGAPEVFIKARGKAISRAVDVEEIVRNRFLPEVKLGGIDVHTQEMDSEDGTKTKVSVIEIKLAK
ncbi:MAG: DNA-binding protein Alba [Candidatus Micrarchaeia archaeon]